MRDGMKEKAEEISHKINVLEEKDICLNFEGKTAKNLSKMR